MCQYRFRGFTTKFPADLIDSNPLQAGRFVFAISTAAINPPPHPVA
jgi:hypothetical protein